MPDGRHEQILQRDNYSCQATVHDPTAATADCRGRLVVHHRRPKGMGGTADPSIHDPDNLITLCDRHHTDVHSRPAHSYSTGLLVRR